MTPGRRASGLALALLVAIATALIVVWPVAISPRETFLCTAGHPDCLGNHWLLGWMAEQLRSGGTLLHNDRYYWPVGDSPWLAGNGGEGFLAAPFWWALGWPLGVNVYLVGVLTLNGVACWALARALGAGRAGALSAAVGGAALVYAVHELGAGRFTQADVAWLAGFLAAWVRLLEAPSLRRAGLAAGLYALAAVLYWYHGLFAALAGGILLLGRLLWAPEGTRATARSLAVPLVAFCGFALALLAWPLGVFLEGWSAVVGTAELGSFPHPETVADSALPAVPFLVKGGRHAGQALAASTVVLALFALGAGLRKDAPDAWKLRGTLLVLVLFVVLTAGTALPGPFSWIYGAAAPLRRFWWPSRHAAVTGVLAVALAARGATPLLAGLRARAGARGNMLTLAAGLLLAVAIPLQLEAQGAAWRALFGRVRWPEPFYAGLREFPGEVLAQPPLAPSVASSQAPLMFQLLHGKTLLGGHAPWVDRVRPPAWDAFVRGNSFLVALQQLERARLTDGVLRFRAADLESLRSRGLRLWVVDPQLFPGELAPLVAAYGAVMGQLFGAPVATDPGGARAWDAARWDGATAEARIQPWTWPTGLGRPAKGLPLEGRRLPGTFTQGGSRGAGAAPTPRPRVP